MKNRNWLVFALCAMMGAAGAACSDDGGDNQTAFTVDPNPITMSAGGSQSVMVTGTAGASFSVTSDDATCSKVTSSEASIPANGVLYFQVTSAGVKCKNYLEVTVGEEKQNVKVEVTENTSSAVISTTTNPLALGGKGSTADVDLTYKKEGEAVGSKALQTVVTVVSRGTEGNDCVQVAESVKTNPMGLATLNVEAIDENCTATIKVDDIDEMGEELTITVTVSANVDHQKTGDVEFYDPKDELGIKQSDGESEFTVLLVDKNGKEVADTYVTIKSSDETCVTLKDEKLKTDANGKATGIAKMANGVATTGCEAKLTAEALSDTDEIKVAVLDKDKFTVSSKINFRKSNEKCKTTPVNSVCACDDTTVDECIAHPLYERIGYVGAIINDVSCEDIFGDVEAEEYADFIQSYKDSDAEFSKEMFTSEKPELTTLSLKNLDSDAASVIVYGKVDGNKDSGILAFACKDISIADDYDKKKKNYVAIELDAILPDMIGQYEIVSNFDLTSGFKRTKCEGSSTTCVPKVENMVAGDWVAFAVDFCDDPLNTLLEFIWSNLILRLTDIPDLKKYLDGILTDTVKTIAITAIKPTLEDWLKGADDKDNWYKILKKVAPDVSDLVKNMQLFGTLNVKEMDGVEIVKATQKYTQLQYQWSYSEPSDKLNDAYGVKPNTWRRSINLGKVNTTISGDWTGLMSSDIEPNASYDAMLSIDKSEISFKWATLLYNVIFGSILPEILDYAGSPSIDKGHLIKALLEKILFQSVVKSYNENDEYTIKVDASVGDDCHQFFTALIYMLNASVDKINIPDPIVKTVGTLVCATPLIPIPNELIEEGGPTKTALIDYIDEAALPQLFNKFESDAQVNFQVKADNCPLAGNADTQVVSIGEPDISIVTANDVFDENKKTKTKRCIWDLDTGIVSNDKNVVIHGIFHATRIDED